MTEKQHHLIGKTVVEVRPIAAAELAEQGWGGAEMANVLVFDDGTTVYPSSDVEGNQAGCLFGVIPGQGPVYI